MEGVEDKLMIELKENIFNIYSDFLTRVTKFDKLVAVGTKLLTDFQQGLEFLRRPPINKTSELAASILQANKTQRVNSYIEVGCIDTRDGAQTVNQSKCMLVELETLAEDASATMQTTNKSLSFLLGKDYVDRVGQQANIPDKLFTDEGISSSLEPYVTDYATLMAIIYSMVKQDYIMQERIICSLNLLTPSGELESYCQMWSLRPFINDEIMHDAWRLIP